MASFGAALTLRSLLEFVFTSKPAYYSQELQIAVRFGAFRATPDQLLSPRRRARPRRARPPPAHPHPHRTLDARGLGEPGAGRRRRRGRARRHPRRMGARRRARLHGRGHRRAASSRSGRRWASTCCCRSSPRRSSAASAASRARCSPGLIVGVAEAMTVQLVGAEWRAAVAFVILVAILLLRPQGLFGRAD